MRAAMNGIGAGSRPRRSGVFVSAMAAVLCIGLAHTAARGQPTAMQDPQPCTVPGLITSWTQAAATVPSTSERRAEDVSGGVGRPYRVRLAPCTAAWCPAGSHAAMVKIEIPKAGRWRVALDTMLWIDVWTADTKLEGVLCEHHGCLPLRKIVQYDLSAGPHWVVLQGKGPGESGLILLRVTD